MKYVRFQQGECVSYGILMGNDIQVIEGDIFADHTVTDRTVAVDAVELLAPCNPTKAVCIGLNYHDHATEMKLELPKQPLIFMKPSSCLANPGGAVEYPAISTNLHYEGEMAIVIGKEARKVPVSRA